MAEDLLSDVFFDAFANAITHARAAHSDRTDAGHDLTLGQTAPPPGLAVTTETSPL